MDPVQALILKLMESQAAQSRGAMNPTSDPGGLQGAQPQPGGAQPPMDDFSAYASHLDAQPQPGPVGTGPGMPEVMGAMSPDDLIAQMLQGR